MIPFFEIAVKASQNAVKTENYILVRDSLSKGVTGRVLCIKNGMLGRALSLRSNSVIDGPHFGKKSKVFPFSFW